MLNKIKKFDIETQKIIKNLLNLSLVKFLTYFIPLITIPYIIRRIGISNFGLIGLAQALGVYYTLFFNFGIGLIAPKEISINIENKQKINYLVSVFYSVKIILFILSFLFFMISYLILPFVRNNLLLFLLYFISSFVFSIFPSWFFIGIQEAKYITIINTPLSIISAAFIFILIKEPKDYILIPVISIFGGIIITIIGIFIILYKFKIRISIYKFKESFLMIKRLFPFFLSRLSINLYTSTGVIILGLLTNNNKMVGEFSIADKVVKLLKDIFSPLYDATMPYFSRLFNQNIKEGAKKIKKFLYMGSLLNLLILFFIILFRKWIIIFFSGSTNQVSEISLILLSSILFFVYPSVMIGRNSLIPLRLEREFNLSIIFGAMTYLSIIVFLFSFTLIFSLHYITILILILLASIITEIIIFSYRYFIYKKEITK